MAGSVRVRKQWQAQDGSCGTLRRLRSQLAEDGCPESQLVIAKHLLEEARGKEDLENEQLAVYWLIQASKQANEEATELLKECFSVGRGITSKNYKQVTECLNMSQTEKLANRAARDLFTELSCSGNGIVSTRKLAERLKLAEKLGLIKNYDSCSNSSHSDASTSSIQFWAENGRIYSEDEFLTMATKAVMGTMPHESLLKDIEMECFSQLSLKEKIFRCPGMTMRIYTSHFFTAIDDYGTRFLKSLWPPGYAHILICVLMLWGFSADVLNASFRIFLFYVAILSAVVSTVKMLQLRRHIQEIRLWNKLLTSLNKDVCQEKSESLFAWNCIRPYLRFFISVALLVFLCPMIEWCWIPAAFLCLMCFIWTITTFASLNEDHDWLIILSGFVIVILQIYPKVHSFTVWGKNSFSKVVPMGSYVHVCFGLPTVLYLIVPVIFLHVVIRNSWQGTLKILIPHLVCITWWQLTMLFFSRTCLYHLIRAVFCLMCFIALIPLWSHFHYTLVFFGLALFLLYSTSFSLGAVAGIAVGITVLLWLLRKWKVECKYNRLKYLIVIFLVLFLTCTYEGLFYGKKVDHIPSTNLTYEQFHSICYPASEQKNLAETQIICSQFMGDFVIWDGKIEMVRVVQTTNYLGKMLLVLPDSISYQLKCILGENRPLLTGEMKESKTDRKRHNVTNHCTVMSWNRYEFEIVLKMPHELGMDDLYIRAGHEFKKCLLTLQRGDTVKIKGLLLSDLGGPRPTLQLLALQCTSCKKQAITVATETFSFPSDISHGLQSLITFMFSPLVEYQVQV